MYPLSNAITRHHLWDNDFQCCPSIWTGIFLCSQGSLSETAYCCWPATLKGFAAFYGQRHRCPSDHGIPPSNLDAATLASDLKPFSASVPKAVKQRTKSIVPWEIIGRIK